MSQILHAAFLCLHAIIQLPSCQNQIAQLVLWIAMPPANTVTKVMPTKASVEEKDASMLVHSLLHSPCDPNAPPRCRYRRGAISGPYSQGIAILIVLHPISKGFNVASANKTYHLYSSQQMVQQCVSEKWNEPISENEDKHNNEGNSSPLRC